MSLQLHGIVPTDTFLLDKLEQEHEIIKNSLSKGYETDYASLSTPFDLQTIEQVVSAVEHIKKLQPTMLLLVGIGGSNMGTMAIVQALCGTFYNDSHPPIKFYCADTVDNDYQATLLALVEQELKGNGSVILCLVTKSGTTTESLVNGSLFLELLKKYRPEYGRYIIAITDADSPLATVACKNNYQLLTIPKKVGGRFSVFTAVSLFPLAFLGINIADFCKGARDWLQLSLEKGLADNEAAQSALMLYSHFNAGYKNHALFVFSPDLFMLGNWYKQLIGESLGKKYDWQGNEIESGFTPFVSVGTVDLHSVVQLYLAGPQMTITTFIDIVCETDFLTVANNEVSDIQQGLVNRSVTSVKKALLSGVTQAYANESRPYMVLSLRGKSSLALGGFMMMKMIETLYLAKLWNINPFDQPAVELYKKYAHRIMSL